MSERMRHEMAAKLGPHPGDDPVARLRHVVKAYEGTDPDRPAMVATTGIYSTDHGHPEWRSGLTYGDLVALSERLGLDEIHVAEQTEIEADRVDELEALGFEVVRHGETAACFHCTLSRLIGDLGDRDRRLAEALKVSGITPGANPDGEVDDQEKLLGAYDAAVEDVARLRARTHEIAEAKDAEHRDATREHARLKQAVGDAALRTRSWTADWTSDQGAHGEYGWWRYTSESNRMEATALVAERNDAQEALKRLLDAAEWLRRCREDVAEGRVVRCLDEAYEGCRYAAENARRLLNGVER